DFGRLETDRFGVFEDKEGTFWISLGDGILKVRKRKKLFENYLSLPVNLSEKLPGGKSIAGIVEGKNGEVFTQEFYGSLYAIAPTGAVSQPFSINIIKSISTAASGTCWMAGKTENIYRLHPFTGVLNSYRLEMEAEHVFEDRQGRIWLEAGDGIYLFDPLSKTTVLPPQLESIRLEHCFLLQGRDELWGFGRQGEGLVKINLEARSPEFTGLLQEKGKAHLRCVAEAEGGKLWLGTMEGLLLVEPAAGKILESFTSKDGLPSDIIYSIVPDDTPLEGGQGGWLWLGTHNGLCRFDPRSRTAKNYFVEDGLSHNEFNTFSYLKTTDGKIWMGGLNGLNAFLPADLERETEPPSVLVWTKFSKYDRSRDTTFVWQSHLLDPVPELVIQPNEQSLTFHFALTSYTDPTKNRYVWYLEGYEPAWKNNLASGREKPVANYQNLPPGEYVFRVKATNFRGNPAQNELAIPVTVLQVWYLRWWAISLAAALLTGAVFLVYRFQLQRKLEHREAERLKEMAALKTRLYTNITHEFRTPLTVILGMAERSKSEIGKLEIGKLEGQSIPSSRDESSQFPISQFLISNLDLIARNGGNLLRLVNQMLNLSKLDSGAMTLHLERGEVVGFLKYLIESFHSLANAKNLRLHFLPEIKQCEMDFDAEKLEQVISNLLSNAIKFTPEGGDVYLKLEIRNWEIGATKPSRNFPISQFLISVRDNGIGIPPDKLPHVFNRFYQVDDTHTRPGEGTGIGLALVKELVKLMNGDISVKSEPGAGAEFTVKLPVRREAPTHASPPDPLKGEPKRQQPAEIFGEITSELPGVGSPFRGSGGDALPLLLIIEDNADVANYIASCFDGECQTAFACNGREGIEQAFEIIPDAIISDVMMPEKDGFEVVQALKNDERTSHVPIILLTAKADAASRLEGLERGADDYLSKPFGKKELQVRLRNLLA
ncbi:MAG: ATP-binding protein, partial [Bacteroidota bacterium]